MMIFVKCNIKAGFYLHLKGEEKQELDIETWHYIEIFKTCLKKCLLVTMCVYNHNTIKRKYKISTLVMVSIWTAMAQG